MSSELSPKDTKREIRIGIIVVTVFWVAAAVGFYVYQGNCRTVFSWSSKSCDYPTRPFVAPIAVLGLIATVLLYRWEAIMGLIRSRKGKVATASPAAPQPSSSQTPRSPKFTRLDFRFNRFVSPTIISIFYVLLNLLALFFVFGYWLDQVGIVSSNGESVVLFMLWSIPLAIVGMGVLWLIIRLICESAIVLFRIAEDLRQIRDRQGQ